MNASNTQNQTRNPGGFPPRFPIIRVILTLLSLGAYGLATFTYGLFRSSIAGTANAQLLTDSVPAYGWHRLIASDAIPSCMTILLLLALLFVWLPLLLNPKTTKPYAIDI
jgi:hypothetical protein